MIMISSSIPIFLLSTRKDLFINLFIYPLIWYKHLGVICLSLLGLGFLIQLTFSKMGSKKLSWRNIFIIDFIIIIAVASDSLFIVQFIIPAIAALVCLYLLSMIHVRRLIINVASLLISVGIGLSLYNVQKLWGWERANLVDKYINFLPEKIINNWQKFENEFITILGNRIWLFIVWISFYITCLIITSILISHSRKIKIGFIRKRTLYASLFLLIQLPTIIGVLIISSSIEVWYFLPIILIPLIWGWPLIAGFLPGLLKVIQNRYVIVSGSIAITLTIIFGLIISNPILKFPNLADYYPSSIACIDQKVGNLGLKRGIAQYWRARTDTLLSKKEVAIVQVSPNLLPFRWENNSDWYKDDFSFIIVDQPSTTWLSINKETVINRFGEPALVYSCEGSEILVYNRPTDTLFKRQFDYTSIKLDDLAPDTLNMTYPAATLPSQIGSIEGNSRIASDGTAVGFLTFGPYLSLPRGKYYFQINFKAEQNSKPEVGRWDVVATNNGKSIILMEGYLVPGNDHISTNFEINEKSAVVEVRTYYEGSGSLAIESLVIKKINENGYSIPNIMDH
jgi:hypothetical protein